MKIDLRPRCKWCRKIPRGWRRLAEFDKYRPYCSYHCQEMGRMDDNLRYAASVAARNERRGLMNKATQKRRFQEALRVLDETPNKEFDMRYWGEKISNGTCRTACCLAGSMSLDPYFRRAGMRSKWAPTESLCMLPQKPGHDYFDLKMDGGWTRAVADVLGISYRDADNLTMPCATDLDSDRCPEKIGKPQVRRRLRFLMAKYVGVARG